MPIKFYFENLMGKTKTAEYYTDIRKQHVNVEWIQVTQREVHWQATVNMVMDIWMLWRWRISWPAGGCSVFKKDPDYWIMQPGWQQWPAEMTCSLMSDLIHRRRPCMLCKMRKVHGICKTTLVLISLELNGLPQSLLWPGMWPDSDWGT
jgi:hypothetical protein